MKLRTTLLLLILNAIVFFFLLRQESPFDLKDEMGKDEISILTFPMSEATAVKVSGAALDSPYTVVKKEGYWVIAEPIEWEANAFAIRRMISRLEAAEVSVRFPVSDIQTRDQTLADFGLETPNFTVNIEYADSEYEYSFGAPVEINDQLYMLNPAKDEILVVDANLMDPFLVELDQLRSRNLFSIPVFEIRSLLVEFNDDNSRRRFTNEEGSWVIDSPFLVDANDERVQGAIDRLVNFEVNFIVPANGEVDYQDVTHFNAIARFEIIGNRRNSTLLVSQYMLNGEVDPNLYRARFEGSETTFLIPRFEIDWWRNSQSSLRERRFLSIDPRTVSKVEVMTTDDSARILRLLKLENDQWKIYSGETVAELVDYEGDAALISELLGSMNDLIILTFVNDAPTDSDLDLYGLSNPRMSLVLESTETTKLEIGNVSDDGQRVYIRAGGSESVYLVANEIVKRLSLDALKYRSRVVSLIPDGTVVSGFQITDKRDQHVTNALSVESLMQSSIQPLDFENAKAIHNAVNVLLTEFSVNGFLDATVEGEFLNYGVLQVELPFELSVFVEGNENAISSIRLSKRLSGSEQVAWLVDEGLAVKLSQDLVDMIHPLIYQSIVPEEWAPAEAIPEVEEAKVMEEIGDAEEANTSVVDALDPVVNE